MKKLIILAVSALLLATAAPAIAKECTKGVACGDTCISKTATCHIKKHKECKKGKTCGDSCIAKDKVCHVKGDESSAAPAATTTTKTK